VPPRSPRSRPHPHRAPPSKSLPLQAHGVPPAKRPALDEGLQGPPRRRQNSAQSKTTSNPWHPAEAPSGFPPQQALARPRLQPVSAHHAPRGETASHEIVEPTRPLLRRARPRDAATDPRAEGGAEKAPQGAHVRSARSLPVAGSHPQTTLRCSIDPQSVQWLTPHYDTPMESHRQRSSIHVHDAARPNRALRKAVTSSSQLRYLDQRYRIR